LVSHKRRDSGTINTDLRVWKTRERGRRLERNPKKKTPEESHYPKPTKKKDIKKNRETRRNTIHTHIEESRGEKQKQGGADEKINPETRAKTGRRTLETKKEWKTNNTGDWNKKKTGGRAGTETAKLGGKNRQIIEPNRD